MRFRISSIEPSARSSGTEQPRVYIVTGHGEPDVDSSDDHGFSFARDGLATDNYDVRPLKISAGADDPNIRGVIRDGCTEIVCCHDVTVTS